MKNILITGASRGIGQAILKALSDDPQHRVLALTSHTATLSASSIGRRTNVQVAALDLLDFQEQAVQDLLRAHFDRVDVVINNAGLLINKPFLELTRQDWLHTFEVNLFGAARLIAAALPWLGGDTPSHIVNIGSMGGFQGSSKFPGLSAYSASKAALANLTECLAEELRPRNIRANCLCLGAVDTEMLRHAFPDYQAPVNPAEMGVFIAQFSLQAHQYLNGKVVPVSLSTP